MAYAPPLARKQVGFPEQRAQNAAFLTYSISVSSLLAEAKITCPALAKEMTLFVMGTDSALRTEISTYGATKEVVEAKMQLKQCADKLSMPERALIGATLVISWVFFVYINLTQIERRFGGDLSQVVENSPVFSPSKGGPVHSAVGNFASL